VRRERLPEAEAISDLDRHRPARPDRAAYAMRALGKSNLPFQLDIGGNNWQLVRTVKHDFWAATGFYENDAGRLAVLKMSRIEDFAGFSLAWIGRFLCRREVRFYNRLSDLPNVPRVIGLVGKNGFVHDYVPGRPLRKDKPVPDGFFRQLTDLLAELHRRDIAYLDTNKPENILLGDDGIHHLIDFQISWDLHDFGNWWLNRWWLRRLQREDFYHILKHKKRLRPDEMTPDELARAEHRSPLIRLHRFLTKPYFKFRRRTFQRLRASGRLLPEGSK
jgi:hypothetical protein